MADGPTERCPQVDDWSKMMKSFNLSIFAIAVLVMGGIAPGPAAAPDKVSVGVFPVSSSLPYFVALERGFFKEQNIEPEMTKLMASAGIP